MQPILLFTFTFASIVISLTKAVIPTASEVFTSPEQTMDNEASNNLAQVKIELIKQIENITGKKVMDDVEFIANVFEVLLENEEIRKGNAFLALNNKEKLQESESENIKAEEKATDGVSTEDKKPKKDPNVDIKTNFESIKTTDNPTENVNNLDSKDTNAPDDTEIVSQALALTDNSPELQCWKENAMYWVQLVQALPVKAGATLLGKFISYEYSYILQHDYKAQNTMYLAQLFSELIENNSEFVADTFLNIFLYLPKGYLEPKILNVALFEGLCNNIFGKVISDCRFYSMQWNARTPKPDEQCQAEKQTTGFPETHSTGKSPSAKHITENEKRNPEVTKLTSVEAQGQSLNVANNSKLTGTKNSELATSQTEINNEPKEQLSSQNVTGNSIKPNVLLDYVNNQLSGAGKETISSNSTIALLLAGVGIAGKVQAVPDTANGFVQSAELMFAQLKLLFENIGKGNWEDCKKHFVHLLLHAPNMLDRFIIAELLSFQLSVIVSEMPSVGELLSIFRQYVISRISLKNIAQLPHILKEILCSLPSAVAQPILKNTTVNCVSACRKIWSCVKRKEIYPTSNKKDV